MKKGRGFWDGWQDAEDIVTVVVDALVVMLTDGGAARLLLADTPILGVNYSAPPLWRTSIWRTPRLRRTVVVTDAH